jgi:hypothetical protein
MIINNRSPGFSPRAANPAAAHGCPVRFFLKSCTALILIGSEGLPTHLDTKKDQHRAAQK